MLIQAVTKRRKDCSVLMFIAFILVWEAVVSLPGFLYFYFWEGAGWVISSLIGFLLGNFVVALLDRLGVVAGAVRRLLGKGDGAKKGRGKETVRTAEGE
ncbi:MAG: hypothetical protein J0L73_24915 [Verrucomicrobia bacterium]|nr:hypothetical protein [Verrucomicrobiota bacterium]